MTETNGQDAPEESRGDACAAPAADSDDSLREMLEEAERERDQFREMAQRAQADLVNYRRRAEDERETLRREITSSLLVNMLELVDDFDRALDFVTDAAVLEGLRNARRGFDRRLGMQGVSRVESAGQQFDPNVHEAIGQSAPTDDHPEGTITSVVREGYMLNDRTLRPAQVIVAVSAALEEENETK